MQITTVIPIRGRLPLLDITLRRLREQTVPITTIILVGNGCDEEREIARKHHAHMVVHGNFPLGKKWVFGMRAAKRIAPKTDYYFHTGSDEWFTNGYTEHMLDAIGGADMVGIKEFVGIQIDRYGMLTGGLWQGFKQSERSKEPIGSGRLIKRKILDALKWELVDPRLDKNLDFSMCLKLSRIGARTKLVSSTDPDQHASAQQVLAISCSLWENKRNITRMIRTGMAKPIEDHTLVVWLKHYFPEIFRCGFFVKER